MENIVDTKGESDRKIWFSMWFLGAVVTFGLAFFPMFYLLVEGRNKHFRREVMLQGQIAAYFRKRGKQQPPPPEPFRAMNAKVWGFSIFLIVPVFVIVYILSKDLVAHEYNQEALLEKVLPKRVFMPQTIPIKTYVLMTLVTFGIGVVYWLYKVVNLYNAHFKAHLQFEKELDKLMEEEKVIKHM